MRFLPLFALAIAFGTNGTPKPPARVPLLPPPPVPREFRAAWVTPIWDRGFKDWPSAPGLSPDSQRAELRVLFDQATAIGLNTIILHVRLAGDAMYPTTYAPWSVYLSGKSGVAPSPAYDPLEFAVTEAHARGLQLHAWFNPFRAMLPVFAGKAAASHVTKRHPEWIRKYGSETWIDPGDPAARQFVLASILDVVKRYDIDGVHLDDYFYPYRESRTVTRRVHRKRVRVHEDIPFPDDKTWKKYGKAEGFTNRDAWRRDNIDQFIQSLYKSVKAEKPAMLVGISPFGIWRSGTPRGITGLDAFSEIYADSRRWLEQGWLDYITPQLYWEVGGVEDRFRVLDAWWRSENPLGRYVWPGLYTAHVYGGRDAWPADAIRTQIESIRDSRIGTTDAPGHVHFRLSALLADNDRLGAGLASAMYQQRAMVPSFPWLGATVPAPPFLTVVSGDKPISLSITPGDSVPVRWWLVQTLGRDGRWNTSLTPTGEGHLLAGAIGTSGPSEVAVTAISATGVASQPALIAP